MILHQPNHCHRCRIKMKNVVVFIISRLEFNNSNFFNNFFYRSTMHQWHYYIYRDSKDDLLLNMQRVRSLDFRDLSSGFRRARGHCVIISLERQPGNYLLEDAMFYSEVIMENILKEEKSLRLVFGDTNMIYVPRHSSVC